MLIEYREKANHPAYLKLAELRGQGCKAVMCDYDGTVHGDINDEASIARLMYESSKRLIPAIITARGATFKRKQLLLLIESTSTHRILQPMYVGLANGLELLRIEGNDSQTIHANHLTLEETRRIIEAYSGLGIEISPGDDQIRQADLAYPWGNIIPENLLALAKRHTGVWIELTKVTVLLGRNSRQWLPFFEELTQLLPELQVSWGGKPVLDITKRVSEDGKLAAAHMIMQLANISEQNIATFGDTPEGNDQYLLSLPFSFTNQAETMIKMPPYNLPLIGTRTQRVHEAIYYLIK